MDKRFNFKGSNCYYKVEGNGKTLMLVHGYVEEGSMWNEGVKELKKKYKLIVPDLPGFGKSPIEGLSAPLSMELYADYIYEIAKREKIKKFVLLGHSMGGYVTLYFAEKHGNLLAGFGLLNSHCFEDSAQKKENRKKGVAFIKQHGSRVFVKELYNSIFHEDFKKKNKKLIAGLTEKAYRYSPEALMQANVAMMNRKDKSEVLKKAKVPVLFINGKEDEAAPFAATLKQASYPSVADIHFFSHAKHMSIFERKKETLKIIEEFIARTK